LKQHDHRDAALKEIEGPWTRRCGVIATVGIEARPFWVLIVTLLLTKETHCITSLDLSSFVKWELYFVPHRVVVRRRSACPCVPRSKPLIKNSYKSIFKK